LTILEFSSNEDYILDGMEMKIANMLFIASLSKRFVDPHAVFAKPTLLKESKKSRTELRDEGQTKLTMSRSGPSWTVRPTSGTCPSLLTVRSFAKRKRRQEFS
jgi:hypothetical protein